MRKLQSDCNILCVPHSLLFLFCVEYDFSQCVAPTVYGTVKYRQHGPQWQQCLGQFGCQFHLQVHLPPSRPCLLFYLHLMFAFLICRLSSSIFYNYKHIWPNNGAAERHCNIVCLTPTHNRTHIRFPTLHNKVHSSLKKII